MTCLTKLTSSQAAGVLIGMGGLLLAGPVGLVAGPPFTTDDPEPVEYQHWEWYVASQSIKTADGWSGTAPHFEVNYGAISNVQLHLIAPLAYSAPAHGAGQWGSGDLELGVKYRFVQETERMPQIGIFPLLEVPTGRADEGLGNGHLQAFLPLWAQKSFGEWTIYGGGGYGINSGAGNWEWGYAGVVLQNQVMKNLLVGGEVYHRTPMRVGEQADTAFNLGAVFDFSDRHHVLFSAGRSIAGPTEFQVYVAYQFTFGPQLFRRGQR
jgi:hypothetical protein